MPVWMSAAFVLGAAIAFAFTVDMLWGEIRYRAECRRERFRRTLRIARAARNRGVVIGQMKAQRQLVERAKFVERVLAGRAAAN